MCLISSIISLPVVPLCNVGFCWEINIFLPGCELWAVAPSLIWSNEIIPSLATDISLWPALPCPAIYFQVWSCQMRGTKLNIRPNRFRFFQPKLFQILYWTKLIIFNQCFLSNCRISIEHINTSNGLDLLLQPTNF